MVVRESVNSECGCRKFVEEEESEIGVVGETVVERMGSRSGDVVLEWGV